MDKKLKDLSKTPFWTSVIADCVTLQVSKMAAQSHTHDVLQQDRYIAQFDVTFQELQSDIVNAIQPVVSSYSHRVYNLWKSLQNKPDDQNECPHAVLAEASTKPAAQSDVANRKDADIVCAQIDGSDLVTKNEDGLGNSASGVSDVQHTIVQQTDAPHQKAPLTIATTITKKESTSFLQVPTFSQDSSNTSNNVSCSKNPLCPDNITTNTSGSSDIQDEAPSLQPYIKQSHFTSASVFHTHKSLSQSMSQLKNHEVHENNCVVKDQNDGNQSCSKPGNKSTTSYEFNFWGDGIDSDFEVKPPAQMAPILSSSSRDPLKRKRGRSLNEAIYDAIISVRKGKHRASNEIDSKILSEGEPGIVDAKGTDPHTSVVNNVGNVQMDDSPFENSAPSNYDEDMLYELEMEKIIQSIPSTPSNFCYNFSSTLVQKEVFKDIVDCIPLSGPRPRVVQIKKSWVDHKTFGLSMRVFGKASKYTIDIMGQAIMVEQLDKANNLGLLPDGSSYDLQTYFALRKSSTFPSL